jgi:hypothetical protein
MYLKDLIIIVLKSQLQLCIFIDAARMFTIMTCLEAYHSLEHTV